VVNPVTDKIYVANAITTITVIDGATNATVFVTVGTNPEGIAVNPVTNTIYTTNYGSNSVTVITDAPVNDTKLWALPDSVAGYTCTVAKPTLTGKAVNRAFSNKCGIEGVFNRVNTTQSAWNWATITAQAGTDSTGWSWNWGIDSLIPGENFLCLYAADSQCATENNLGLGTPFTGNVTVFPLYYLPGGTTGVILSSANKSGIGPSLRMRNGTISYSLGQQCPVELRMYDMLGKKVFEFNRQQSAGSYSFSIRSLNLSTGEYILHFKAGSLQKDMAVMEK
jgi:hypothetical protein